MLKKIIIVTVLLLSVTLNVVLICTLKTSSSAMSSDQQGFINNYHSFSDNYDDVKGEFSEHRVLLGEATLFLDSNITIDFFNGVATSSEIIDNADSKNGLISNASISEIADVGAK